MAARLRGNSICVNSIARLPDQKLLSFPSESILIRLLIFIYMKKILPALDEMSQAFRFPALLVFVFLTAFSAFAQSPAAPTGFTAVPSGAVLQLSWTDNAHDETGYILEKQWDDEFSNTIQINLPANAENYTDTEVAPNIQYYYSIWAENEDGASDQASAIGTISRQAPPVPTNVSAVTGPMTSIQLSFTDNSDLETWYEIRHSHDPNEASFYGNEKVSGGALHSTITHFISDGPFNYSGMPLPDEAFYPPNTTVYIKVRAVINDNGTLIYGPFSEVVSAVTNPLPPTPTNFISSITGHGIHLSWTDNSMNEAAFFLAKFVGEFNPNTISLIKLPLNASEYTDSDIEPGVEYNYWLMAVDLFEYSSPRPEYWPDLFVNASRVVKTSAVVPLASAPDPPVTKPATYVTPKSFTANWEPVNGALYYELDVFNIKDSTYLQGYEGRMVNGVTHVVNGTKGKKGYAYVVRAVNDGGESENSNSMLVSPVKNLRLQAVCSDSPGIFRRWEVINDNPFDVDVQWRILNAAQTGSHVATTGNSFFTTPTAAGSKVAITWYDDRLIGQSTVKSSSGKMCSTRPNGNARKRENENQADDGGMKSVLNVQVYPNPVRDRFQILVVSPDNSVVEVEIINYHGKRLFMRNVDPNTAFDVDASAFASGIYILKARQSRARSAAKIIKQ
jgi:hypothetical protein